MEFHVLKPEVAGGFGPGTILEQGVHPPRPTYFEYQFDGWPSDALITTVGNFIVTFPLKLKSEQAGASGVAFDRVVTSTSGEFEDFNPGLAPPPFAWMKIFGVPGRDDFGIDASYRLVVSERVLNIIKSEGLDNCAISPYIPPALTG